MKLRYITLSENKLPESRLLMDGQKEKIDNKVIKNKKNNNENKLEKKNKKALKIKKKVVLKKNHKFKVNFMK